VITGGGGGLGKAMAKYLIEQKKKVIIVGRTESNLKETSKEIGAAGYYLLDTGAIDSV
jgi:short-subunit dehydrogenase